MQAVDLHVHSNKSDGTFTPTELVALAKEKGLAAFALTDHDTTDGIEEAMAAAKGTDLEVIPGIELSTEYEGKDIHIVGLFLDYQMEGFQERIHTFADARDLRNKKMCDAMCADGIQVPYDDLMKENAGAIVTRAHYASYMVAHGIVKSTAEAFSKYIGDDCPYFIPRKKISPQMAVKFILEVHGLPILAHPFQYHLGNEGLETLVQSLKAEGLAGIEAIYSTHTPHDEQQITELCDRYDLLMSGGSDFHGANKKDLDLGTGYGRLFVPDTLLTAMKHKLHGVTDQTKVFMADYDGTLVNSEKELTPLTKKALDAWVAAGNIMVLCSGRALSNVKELATKHDLQNYPHLIVSGFNGAEAYDWEAKETIFRDSIDLDTVRKVFALAAEYGIYAQTYTEDHIVCKAASKELDYYRHWIPMPVVHAEDVTTALEHEPCKCIAISLDQPEQLEKLRLALNEALGDVIQTFYSNEYYLEVTSIYADKGRCLKNIMRSLGLPMSNAVAAGDSGNDIPMIRAAGVGIAMCNGVEKMPIMKEAADIVTTKDNDHDGLATVLNNLMQ